MWGVSGDEEGEMEQGEGGESSVAVAAMVNPSLLALTGLIKLCDVTWEVLLEGTVLVGALNVCSNAAVSKWMGAGCVGAMERRVCGP